MKRKLFVTNFNKNFTGVSATAANVIRAQMDSYDLALVGRPLPGCPDPITVKQARAASTDGAIWHVRRNTEMRAALWARDILRLPIKIVFTSAAQRRHSAYPRWLISRMDAVIATTDKAASFVPHVRAVVPHGVDTALFHPAQDRAKSWQALGYGGNVGIATIGRIRPEKGTDHFVKAMIDLLPDHPDAVALVLGKATREHQAFLAGLKDDIKAAGLTDRILFPGEIPAQDLPALMRALSLVVQLPQYEGYGMVPLEAMASGVPFIGYEAGYYSAFSAQGRAGVIVDTPKAAALAARQILNGNVDKMGNIARTYVIENFSAKAEADGIDAVYQMIWAQG
ncbi:glycosyltransferase family 4 protein [Sulfitobacter sp. CW3]|uniref:glycosyltransferase family 4 protein n=1 Tax=Sulfitobacter sp. CW3 TaxID=2861965 RepID=UPI001C5CE1A6|nr:glycosyltransferase family 4 protein [Sulfitobacter sp. CW3]MBW4960525.1 glycosyltransferase family 4 protein [Sulfitobacter sp. CW3]